MVPKVSVIMAVYNAEQYLTNSINSILLDPTFTELELIIINDGSTDNSWQIIKSFEDNRVISVNQRNAGNANARNKAIALANSEMIAILDADDVSLPCRINIQYKFLSENHDYIVVGSNAEVIDKDGHFIFKTTFKTENTEIKSFLPKMPFVHSSIMFRKTAFYKAGGYPENMLVAQDAVLINKMSKLGKFYNFSNCLVQYRIVPTANSNRNENEDSRFKDIFLKVINNESLCLTDIEFLKSITKDRNSNLRLANYYFYIGKKYLFNNPLPNKARNNFKESYRFKKRYKIHFYILLTFLPKSTINLLYRNLKVI